MYELIQLSQRCYYLDCPSKIGLIRTGEDTVVAIDSGNDKDAGKKLLRILQEKGWTLDAIYNTHSHADHIGGNHYLQEQTHCRIYACGIECDFTNHPLLEPACLYGGFPPAELCHKFLRAQESEALPLTEDVLPEGVQLLSLPGHSFAMAGFLADDGVAYVADSLCAEETLEKYGISYLWDVGAYLSTLASLSAIPAKIFVPAHAPVCENIASLAQYNAEATRATAEKIADLCASPIGFDALLQKVFDGYGLTMTVQQHALLGSTLRSYLSWLQGEGKVACRIENNQMLFEKI